MNSDGDTKMAPASGNWYVAEHRAALAQDEHSKTQHGDKYDQGAPTAQTMSSVPSVQAVALPTSSQGPGMPAVLAEAEIVQQYQLQGMDTSALQDIPMATAAEVPQAGTWFSPDEVAVLNSQVNPNSAGGGGSQVLLHPGNGGLPVMNDAVSTAKVERDSMKHGVVSRDEILSTKEEILKFLNMHNTRPTMGVMVHGYHYRTTGHGDKRRRRRVTDFRYKIDITELIFPYGKVICKDSTKSVESMIENYLQDTNKLRSLQMKKSVVWNTNALVHLIKAYIRQCGFARHLDVTMQYDNTSVRVCDNNSIARSYDNTCCRCMMSLTVLPALSLLVYGNGHRERGLKSTFTIEASPLQVFEYIRPRIHVPSRNLNICMIQ